MKIALLADIHGNLSALDAVIDDLERRQVDRVVNLGDHASGPLLPLQTVRRLMALDWLHLAGNHERQLLTLEPEEMNASDQHAHAELDPAARAWMAAQQSAERLDEGILFCLGTPSCDTTYCLETVTTYGPRMATEDEIRCRLGSESSEQQLVACAHTHIPRSIKLENGPLLVNPGSVGLPAYDDHHPHYHVMRSGSPDARYAVVERRAKGWVSELVTVPYDHLAMAALAARNGRADWETALRKGSLPIPS